MRKEYTAAFLFPFCLTFGILVLYVYRQATGIYGGDSGELVSAAYTFGIAHPPGYPLYIFLSGLLAHLLPISTIAWRVGLLSSVPMAISCYFVWLTIHRLTKRMMVAMVATLFYAFLYPVWLYGIVAEVFGLFALFSALFLYVFIRLVDTKERSLLYVLAVLTGVSLTHQYLIILIVVSAVFILYRYDKGTWVYIKQKKLFFLAAVGIGLIPLLYAPIASFFNPPFDREHAASLVGFFRLVSRVSVGGFRASSVATGGIFNGLADLATFAQYLYKDFTFVGIILAGVGLYGLWKKEKTLFSFFIVYLFLLILYLFYAGFPVYNNFQLGTLERFFIIPYQVFAVLLGLGLSYVLQTYTTLFIGKQKQFSTVYSLLLPMFWAMVLILPIVTFRKNYTTLSLLKTDRTVEQYADDVLRSIPNGAVFGAYQDTTAGAINYAFFVQKKRPDIVYLNFYLLSRVYYRQQIAASHPDIIFPEYTPDTPINDYITDFIVQNEKNTIVTSDVELPGIPGYWVPSGLVYVYYSTIEAIPDRQLILDKNNRLWQTFSDPLSGSLGRFKHLLLSDVLRYYADHALTVARAYSLVGKFEDSQRFMTYALNWEVNLRVDAYKPLIDQLIDKKECSPARVGLDALYTKWGDDFVILEEYHTLIQKCFPDDANLHDLEQKYQRLKSVYDKPIL